MRAVKGKASIWTLAIGVALVALGLVLKSAIVSEQRAYVARCAATEKAMIRLAALGVAAQ
jgi:hypothetical protein